MEKGISDDFLRNSSNIQSNAGGKEDSNQQNHKPVKLEFTIPKIAQPFGRGNSLPVKCKVDTSKKHKKDDHIFDIGAIVIGYAGIFCGKTTRCHSSERVTK